MLWKKIQTLSCNCPTKQTTSIPCPLSRVPCKEGTTAKPFYQHWAKSLSFRSPFQCCLVLPGARPSRPQLAKKASSNSQRFLYLAVVPAMPHDAHVLPHVALHHHSLSKATVRMPSGHGERLPAILSSLFRMKHLSFLWPQAMQTVEIVL